MRSIVVLLCRGLFNHREHRGHRGKKRILLLCDLCVLCGSWLPADQHQRRLTSVCITWSCILIVCALAWYTRCAVIMFTSSAVMSTFDSSSAHDCSAPRLPSPGTPTIGSPVAKVRDQALPPIGCRPCGLRKVAISTCPAGLDWPLE